MTVAEEVELDLKEMAQLTHIPERVIDYPRAHSQEMETLRKSGMKIHQISDYIILKELGE